MEHAKPSIRTRFLIRVMALLPMVLAAVAAAQTAAPPMPSLRRSTPAWLGYLVMFLLLSIVVTVSLMPSKRSHQD
jgi:FtsH-binding integral membrane protein